LFGFITLAHAYSLKYNGTTTGGCGQNEVLTFIMGEKEAPPVWIPDVYFANARKNDLGLKNDGSSITVSPDGRVFWTQRIRIWVNCKMHIAKLPWDEQLCSLVLGPYSQNMEEVEMVWADGAALANLENQTSGEWSIGEGKDIMSIDPPKPLAYETVCMPTPDGEVCHNKSSSFFTSKTGNYSESIVSFVLKRRPAIYDRIIFMTIFFVGIQYLGLFIDPAAAPGRIALGVLMVLIVSNHMAAFKSRLPKVSYAVWLADFMFGCMILNIFCFFTYVLVNFGMQAHTQLEALIKADKEKASALRQALKSSQQSDSIDLSPAAHTTDRSVVFGFGFGKQNDRNTPMRSPIDLDVTLNVLKPEEVPRDDTWLKRLAKLRGLDRSMRMIFPLVFGVYIAIMYGIIHTYPNVMADD